MKLITPKRYISFTAKALFLFVTIWFILYVENVFFDSVLTAPLGNNWDLLTLGLLFLSVFTPFVLFFLGIILIWKFPDEKKKISIGVLVNFLLFVMVVSVFTLLLNNF